MLDRLIALALRQRLLLGVLIVVLAGAGTVAALNLPIDAFPDVSSTQVKVIVKVPGMTPEEVEARITLPIEQELLGIPGQRMLRSQSKTAIADITLDFDDSTDIYWARQQVSERLNAVWKDLPSSAAGGLAPITTPLGEMFMFTIEGPLSDEEKRTLLDWTIRPQLRAIPGVADLNALGGQVRSYVVEPDLAALSAHGLSLASLQAALEANNQNDGAGRVGEGEEALLVRSGGSIRSLDDLRAITIAAHQGTAVRVGDVARVRTGALTRYGVVTRDGKGEAVEGLVLGLRGANARLLVGALRDKLAEIETSLPVGVKLVPFYDRGNLVSRATQTVGKALAEAIVLVLVLLYLFLGNVRAALVVAFILPLSALGTFLLMRMAGLSANLMSLGGLAIAIGMLVDAAVVVVENIEAHLADARDRAQPLLEVIGTAVREVAVPISSGIAIIVIVFLPLLSLQGLEGKLFSPVALTIVFALGASLLLSLTVIPMLASLILGRAPVHRTWLVARIEAGYAKLLARVLARPRVAYVAAGAGLVAAIAVLPFVGKSFMPTLDEGDIIMQLEKLPSISLARAAEVDLAVQRRILAEVPEVSHIVARAGSDELGLDPMGPNETDTFLVLKPRDQWRQPDKEKLIDALRQIGASFAGVNVSFSQPIEMRTAEMLSGVRGDLAIKIYGPDMTVLGDLGQRIAETLRTIDGSEDVLTVRNEGVEYLQVEPDRAAMGRLGVSVDQLQSALRALVEGRHAGIVLEQGRRLPLIVRVAPPPGEESGTVLAPTLTPTQFEQVRIPVDGGGAVPLTQLARIGTVSGPVKIERENASRMVVVRANVRGRDLVGFVDEARRRVAERVTLPAGYRLGWGGQFENQQRAAARLMLVVPIALALIFVLLYLTFGSLRQATLVLANIPFAMVGGVLALALSGEYLSVPASVGLIALMGIAVLNGLVLITAFNHLRDAGLAANEVVSRGALRRLRPVLMTAACTLFGLLPLLFATGPGSEIQRPLAIVVTGGLLSSTLLTLVLLPAMFARFGMEKSA